VSTGSTTRDASALKSPYVGLNFYTQENAAMFFGRDSERTVLISNLRVSRLTLLYAKSGTGKSSLLRAGAAASLADLAQRSFDQRGSARNIPVVFSSWRDDPTAGLIGEIQKAISPFLSTASPPTQSPDRLEMAMAAANRATDAALLVILDQFEDYLLYQSGEARDRSFADELAACINQPDLRANFLISIREDAYFALGDVFKGRISNVYGNYFRLEHLTREAAREAIEKPITSFNDLHIDQSHVQIEPGLVDAVLSQFGPDQPAPDHDSVSRLAGGNSASPYRYEVNPSYLQLVMKRLWDVELGKGSRKLRLQTLKDLGGAETIVRTHVERALWGLAEGEREAAAAIFHHLVTPSGTKIALTASDLAAYSKRPAEETDALLQRLASSEIRILRPVPPPPGKTDGTRFEISHDLLVAPIQRWDSRHKAVRLEQEKEAEQARAERIRALTFRTMAIAFSLTAVLVITSLAIVVPRNGERPAVTAGTAISGLTTTIQFPAVSSVQAGSSITGQISFINQMGTTMLVRLMLANSEAEATITSPAGVVTVPAGNTPSVPFTISFGKDSPIGAARLHVIVADIVNPSLVYNEATLNINVTKPLGFLPKYFWNILGLLIAIILIISFALWRRAVLRRRVDVRGLVAILRRNGGQLGGELPAPPKWSDSFRFIVRDEFEPSARLDFPMRGSSPYTVRRAGNGEVTLMTPTSERYEHIVVDGPGERLDNGLEIAFRDRRRPRAAAHARAVRPPKPETRPVPSLPGSNDDPWL